MTMPIDPEILRTQYEATVEALEDELEFEKQRSAKCRIAKAALTSELEVKRSLLASLSYTLDQHRLDIANLIVSLESLSNALPEVEDDKG
jgi:flagellar biosynthesis/type III secretory pathway chaperone